MSAANVHELKTWPSPFDAAWRQHKTHEIRKADRDFKQWDVLYLREWEPSTEEYTGRECRVEVTYFTPGGDWGLPENLCVMSIVRLAATTDTERSDG